jgi:hypothetical protein
MRMQRLMPFSTKELKLRAEVGEGEEVKMKMMMAMAMMATMWKRILIEMMQDYWQKNLQSQNSPYQWNYWHHRS